jgi:hypothetical protein
MRQLGWAGEYISGPSSFDRLRGVPLKSRSTNCGYTVTHLFSSREIPNPLVLSRRPQEPYRRTAGGPPQFDSRILRMLSSEGYDPRASGLFTASGLPIPAELLRKCRAFSSLRGEHDSVCGAVARVFMPRFLTNSRFLSVLVASITRRAEWGTELFHGHDVVPQQKGAHCQYRQWAPNHRWISRRLVPANLHESHCIGHDDLACRARAVA